MPVTALVDVTYEKEFMQYGGLIFEPDSVMVKGPARMIEKMDHALLGTVSEKNLKSNKTVRNDL